MSVDGRDDEFSDSEGWEVDPGSAEFIEAAFRREIGVLGGVRQIRSGAKGATGSGDDDRANGIVLVTFSVELTESGEEITGAGIHLIGAIESEGRDAGCIEIEENGLLRHH
jgi:hypothetical protein